MSRLPASLRRRRSIWFLFLARIRFCGRKKSRVAPGPLAETHGPSVGMGVGEKTLFSWLRHGDSGEIGFPFRSGGGS